MLVTLAAELRGGSRLTKIRAEEAGKPLLHLHGDEMCAGDAETLRAFLRDRGVHRYLNVAGSRESEEPGIYARVYRLFSTALIDLDNCS